MNRFCVVYLFTFICSTTAWEYYSNFNSNQLNLQDASIIIPENVSIPFLKAVNILVNEVYKRTVIQLPVTNSLDYILQNNNNPLIFIDSNQRPNLKEEGFQITVNGSLSTPTISIIGYDDRGVLFGVGRFLREVNMFYYEDYQTPLIQNLTIASELVIVSFPDFPLRGHLISYRSISNSYDAWDILQMEQYVKDLAVFGTNEIGMVGPDGSTSPYLRLNITDMIIAVSQVLDDYGLNMSLWYPTEPIENWGFFFKYMKRLDVLFIPSGDPGNLDVVPLFDFAQNAYNLLQESHPGAQLWLSCQMFNESQMNQFYDILENNPPSWLSGIVYGPHTRDPYPITRSKIPMNIPIRHYPDLAHGMYSQFPNPDWSFAYAFAEGREIINPRPQQEAMIISELIDGTIGFGAYSDGCNDDVNKIVWSSLVWSKDKHYQTVMEEYARYFIRPDFQESFSQGIINLEQNWRGPLQNNANVNKVLQSFQNMEQQARPIDLMNWRFQQNLYRAYSDAYIRARLIHETNIEKEALAKLQQYPTIGSIAALNESGTILNRSSDPIQIGWKIRIFQLAEALFQSIHMKLSVPLYKSVGMTRGASLDTIDVPLNNILWLNQQYQILKTVNESMRIDGIKSILNFSDPGPGGYHDDLGSVGNQPHLVVGEGWKIDPSFYYSSLSSFINGFNASSIYIMPYSWYDYAESYYDSPLEMQYSNLNPTASYKIRVVYAGDVQNSLITLYADNTIQIHPYIQKPYPPQILTFNIPQAATSDGQLLLSWFGELGIGSNGRGCQIAEVWLVQS